MKSTTKENLYDEYRIYKILTPNKYHKTSIAMKEDSNGDFYSVILKEMDQKQAWIYSELSNMWNPYIADTYEVFSIPNSDTQDTCKYIAVTEYVSTDSNVEEECISLTQFVRKNGILSESASLSICIQICKGLKEFHEKGFVHRDLKPDNIMISHYDIQNPQIKIIDFGSAKEINFHKTVDTTVIGTLGYQAPESVSNLTTNQSDIYSIGCILKFMLTGQEPGIQQYNGNHYIVNIIEKTSYTDATHRYKNTLSLQKDLEHELRVRTLDKIPILRAIPGFRSHTLWKESIASFFYISMIFLTSIYLQALNYANITKILVFYVTIPFILIFNMGNLLRFFPKRLRHNYHLFFMIRIALLLSSMFLPLLYTYFTEY